ncbi:hypothetical protein [Psychromonas aquimarina]|uniref:hypothetical protein n=1 Tax=Psychromonas aquimarina TaxID=444919 RepID=UPI00048FE331|nr:hypothetical protein [Psychromonas aquimarina]
MNFLTKKAAAAALLLAFNISASEFEYSGKIGIEERYFFAGGQYEEQFEHWQTSFSVEPEFTWNWNDGVDSLVFTPFYRFDAQDEQRTHGDIRELFYIHVGDDWEFRAGIRKEFWGVTEFQHLVDVINQTDGVEGFDGEDKLGQQMLNLSLVRDWGIIDLYLLPGFRERTFPGEEGRLRGPLVVDKNNVSYESSAEDKHIDFAARWSHVLGDFDIGSYWFHGTNRDPLLTPAQNGQTLVLRQYYNQMDQLGIDVQATIDDWLWKFESIYRSTKAEDFGAVQAGFEYTYVGVFDSFTDLGLLMEYGWDSRGEAGASAGANVQNDLFLGSRIAFNDMQDSEVLMGFSTDLDHNAFSILVEASRRFGDSFKANLDFRMLQSSEYTDQLYSLKDDDHLQVSLDWYF